MRARVPFWLAVVALIVFALALAYALYGFTVIHAFVTTLCEHPGSLFGPLTPAQPCDLAPFLGLFPHSSDGVLAMALTATVIWFAAVCAGIFGIRTLRVRH